jgi:hypothetical protein
MYSNKTSMEGLVDPERDGNAEQQCNDAWQTLESGG